MARTVHINSESVRYQAHSQYEEERKVMSRGMKNKQE
jgi:hypothetical protein